MYMTDTYVNIYLTQHYRPWLVYFFYLIFEDFSRDFGQDSLSGAHRGGYMPPLVKQETLAESFYYSP